MLSEDGRKVLYQEVSFIFYRSQTDLCESFCSQFSFLEISLHNSRVLKDLDTVSTLISVAIVANVQTAELLLQLSNCA